VADKGLDKIPFSRIPETWSAAWYARHIREVLALADTRNAIAGDGIVISGAPDVPATISADADILALRTQPYILAESSAFLPNERILTGQSGFITATDGGAGGEFTIGIDQGMNPRWTGQHVWENQLYGPMGSADYPTFSADESRHDGLYFPDFNNVGIATAGVLRWDINGTRVQQSNVYLNLTRAVAIADTYYDAVRVYNSSGHGGLSLRLYDGAPLGDDAAVVMDFVSRGVFSASDLPASRYGFTVASLGHGINATEFVLNRVNAGVSTTVMQAFDNASQILFPNVNSASAPGVSFIGNTGTGIYSGTAGTLRGAAGSSQVFGATSTTFNFTVSAKAINGAANAPSWSFVSDDDNGLYYIGTNNWGMSAGGTLRWDINTTRIVTTLPQQGPAGSASAPTYSASGDTNTGMYLPGSDVLAFATAGTLRYQFGAAGQLGIGGATYGTANTQAIVSGGASAAPSWQTVLVDGQTQTLGGAKTWSAAQTFNDDLNLSWTAPRFVFVKTDGGADQKRWYFTGQTDGQWRLFMSNDAISTFRDVLLFQRSGNVLTGMDYGNSTDNPPHTFYGTMNIGDPGSESGSVQLDGASYDAVAKINEFGGSNDAALVLHRHANGAAVAANMLLSRARGNTSAHSDVQDQDVLGRFIFAGWYTASYYRAAEIDAIVNGTPGAGDMPGALLMKVSPDGSNAPAEVARFDANATAGNTRFMIYDVDNGTVERVSVGAADSGGTGFKVLRIPN
jgi:hypothetical protein